MCDFRGILFVHIEKVRHRGAYRLLGRVVRCHGDESAKHLEKSAIPEFDDIMMSRESFIDKGAQVLADRLAPMPVADAQIGDCIRREAIKAFALCLVVDFLPECE